jgi:Na+/melibiose symporter-like transporter
VERLERRTKHAYGFGEIAEGVKNTAFTTFLLFYFNQVLGLSGTLAGVALFTATALDAVSDSLMGSYSDRFVHRWGRRHLFMYASVIPLAVTFALLWSPPAGASQTVLFLWLLAFAIGVRQSMTLFHVPHMALGAELTSDYQERTGIVAYRTAYGVLGVALTIGFAWSWFFRGSAAYPNGQYDPSVYAPFGLFFGLIIAATAGLSALGTHSRIPFLPRAASSQESLSLRVLARDYLGALSNASFRPFFIGLVIFFIVRGIQDVLGLYMTSYFWRITPEQIRAVSLAALPGAVLGIPFWVAIAARIDKRATFLTGLTLFTCFIFAPPMAKLAGVFPAEHGPGYMPLLALCTALATFSAIAGLVVSGSMLADITDEHELETGRRQEGVFFGALSFSVKASSGLGTLLAGAGLDMISFPTRSTPGGVEPEKVEALAVLYGPGIALLAGISIAFLARYRIDRARHAEIARELAVRRAAPAAQSP